MILLKGKELTTIQIDLNRAIFQRNIKKIKQLITVLLKNHHDILAELSLKATGAMRIIQKSYSDLLKKAILTGDRSYDEILDILRESGVINLEVIKKAVIEIARGGNGELEKACSDLTNFSLFAIIDYFTENPNLEMAAKLLNFAENNWLRKEIIELFVDRGVEINWDSINGILTNAVKNKNLSLISDLIKLGINVKGFSSSQEKTILHLAAAEGDVSFIKGLLDLGCDKNTRDSEGNRAWYYALENDRLETFLLLVDEDLTFIEFENRNTILHQAIKLGSETIATHLAKEYDHTSFINHLNEKKESPLLLAVKANKAGIVKSLISAGADIEFIGTDGAPIFHEAIKWRNEAIAQYFIDKKPELINSRDLHTGNTALHIASSDTLFSISILKFLLNKEACCSMTNNDGNTALHIAAKNKNSEAIIELVKAGSRLSPANAKGKTPGYFIDKKYKEETYSLNIESLEIISRFNEQKEKFFFPERAEDDGSRERELEFLEFIHNCSLDTDYDEDFDREFLEFVKQEVTKYNTLRLTQGKSPYVNIPIDYDWIERQYYDTLNIFPRDDNRVAPILLEKSMQVERRAAESLNVEQFTAEDLDSFGLKAGEDREASSPPFVARVRRVNINDATSAEEPQNHNAAFVSPEYSIPPFNKPLLVLGSSLVKLIEHRHALKYILNEVVTPVLKFVSDFSDSNSGTDSSSITNKFVQEEMPWIGGYFVANLAMYMSVPSIKGQEKIIASLINTGAYASYAGYNCMKHQLFDYTNFVGEMVIGGLFGGIVGISQSYSIIMNQADISNSNIRSALGVSFAYGAIVGSATNVLGYLQTNYNYEGNNYLADGLGMVAFLTTGYYSTPSFGDLDFSTIDNILGSVTKLSGSVTLSSLAHKLTKTVTNIIQQGIYNSNDDYVTNTLQEENVNNEAEISGENSDLIKES